MIPFSRGRSLATVATVLGLSLLLLGGWGVPHRPVGVPGERSPVEAPGVRLAPSAEPGAGRTVVVGSSPGFAATDAARTGVPTDARTPLPATKIDPLSGYSREPAPMGIADYGVTGPQSTATAYEYATTSFEGQASINSMDVTISGTSAKVTAFELNEVLVLRLDGTNYSYWIQNGLHVDAGTREFTIGGAYVWNFSAAGARLTSGEVRGNASSMLATDTYYFLPNCGVFAGQCSTLTWPAQLTGRVVTASSGGTPYVDYEYDLGAGWVTYDNVSFLHMNGATIVGFVVDGYQPTPISANEFYDAEWDWVAAGGGSSSVVQSANLSLSLDFWNGKNYQAVPSAWNFGGNTGETASNVSERFVGGAGGAPAAAIASGPGTLGVLYNLTQVGFLNVTIPTQAPEVLRLNGTETPLAGGSLNLTLRAGSYGVSLQNYSNASAAVFVAPGATTLLNLSGAGEVEFIENGLPRGSGWGVSVDGLARGGSSPTLALNLPNGTYAIVYSPVPGFLRNASDPVALSVPTAGPIGVGWRAFTYSVPISEEGLPASTGWWVTLDGLTTRGTSPTIDVTAPNGSTPYTVGASYAFVATPMAGTIAVVGGLAAPISIEFAYRDGYIAGTVTPASAGLSLDGADEPVVDGAFNVSVLPGEFTIAASADGYTAQTLVVSASAGNVTEEQIVLNATPSSVAPPPTTTTSASGPPWAILLGVGAVGAAVAVAAVLFVRRRAPRG